MLEHNLNDKNASDWHEKNPVSSETENTAPIEIAYEITGEIDNLEKPEAPDKDINKQFEPSSTRFIKEPPSKFKKELEKLILHFITVFAGGYKFSGVLVCVMHDFIVLINGCTIFEIVFLEITAVEFKAPGCPEKKTNKIKRLATLTATPQPMASGKKDNRTKKEIKNTGQEPAPENPRDQKLSLQEQKEYGKASEKSAPADQEEAPSIKKSTPRYLSRPISVEKTAFTPPRMRTKKTIALKRNKYKKL
ncbi:MAG: hypothetical protein GX088_00685 [Clostridia bacterium]|nr:hypothetical protein [Clostridia bacterium]